VYKNVKVRLPKTECFTRYFVHPVYIRKSRRDFYRLEKHFQEINNRPISDLITKCSLRRLHHLSSGVDKMREDLWERSFSRANALTRYEVVSYKRTSVTEKRGNGGG